MLILIHRLSNTYQIRRIWSVLQLFKIYSLVLYNTQGSDSPTGHQKDNIRTFWFGCYLFIQAAGLAWNQCACALYGIAKGVWHHARACISVGLIPYATSSQLHTATRVTDSMHAFGVIGKQRGLLWQKIYCLNIQNDWLVILQCFAKLIRSIQMLLIKSKNHHPAFLQTFQKHNTLKVLLICYLNLRLQEKNVWKQKAGSN